MNLCSYRVVQSFGTFINFRSVPLIPYQLNTFNQYYPDHSKTNLIIIMTVKPMKIHCLADVCITPIGTTSVSGSDTIAKVQLYIKESGLNHTLHSAGTTIEGEWDEVMNLIGQLHLFLHEQGIPRLHSDIRVGTRIDKHQTAKDKVDTVLEKMAKGFD